MNIFKLFLEPTGERKRSYEQVRQEQAALGGVDFAAFDALPREDFRLPVEGAELACAFLPAIPPNKPDAHPRCIIRVHGHSQNMQISVRFIKAFMDMGYAALIYDHRAFGRSTGTRCTLGKQEAFDLSRVIDWAKARLGDDCIIGLHGESMGAITSMLCLGIDRRIDFAVIDAGAACFGDAVGYLTRNMLGFSIQPLIPLAEQYVRRKYGLCFSDIRPIDAVRESDVPLLFFHSTGDMDIYVSQSEQLFAAARNPLSRLEIFEGPEHCQSHSSDPPRYERIEKEFVRAVEATLSACNAVMV
ncbi:MAG: alpha/beta hydrolase [Oscillospiraceae bacterium]|nr:alpha/beta hydrolase [Oscillospiraceae bacterium]